MLSQSVVFAALAAVALLASAPGAGAYNILGIFPSMSRSHHICGSALMRGLAAAGHNVTVLSPFPLKTPPPNYRDIAVLGIVEQMSEFMPNMLEMESRNILLSQVDIHFLGVLITNYTLAHPVTRAFLADPTEQFDVIVCEVFLNEAMLGFGHHFKAPIIGYSTFGASVWTTEMVGSPSPLSYVPHAFLSFTDHMTFTQRVANVLMTMFDTAFSNRLRLHSQAALYEEHFASQAATVGAEWPSMEELRRNVALVLLNTHHTLGTVRPYVPNMIEIGGVHINRNAPRELPEPMRAFVEGAEHGVVYFSLGSNLRSADLPAEKRAGILRALGALRQRVLWKFEDTELAGKPDNVFVSKWFPQDDVLAHPKVRLFVTHGGLLSTTEAIYHGVPLVGIPVFGDQSLNMGRAEAGGYARMVKYSNLTEASLSWAIGEVLGVESYARQASVASQRYRDQPIDPLALGVYWVEYVARHRGAAHMHCAGQDLSVWVYHSVDVFATLAAMLVAFLSALWWLVKWCACAAPAAATAGSRKKRN